MSEKIKSSEISDISNPTPVGHFFLNAVGESEENLKKLITIRENPKKDYYTVKLTIDGIEFPVRKTLDNYYKYCEEHLDERARKMIATELQEKVDKLNDTANSIVDVLEMFKGQLLDQAEEFGISKDYFD